LAIFRLKYFTHKHTY